jgi:signal transduction histidine kinase
MKDLPENRGPGLGQTQELLLQSCWNETLNTATVRLVHDFNNLLTGILSLSDAIVSQVTPENPLYEGLSLMNQNARHAAEIVEQISRLYREKPGRASYQDLNQLATAFGALLQRIFPRHTSVALECASESMPVYLDAVEFRKVVLTIAFLFAEALPSQGEVRLRTSASKGAVSLEISATGVAPNAERLRAFFEKQDGLSFTPGALACNFAQEFLRKNGGGLARRIEEGCATVSLSLPKSDFTELERDLQRAGENAPA